MIAGSVHKRVGGTASMEAHFLKSVISCMHRSAPTLAFMFISSNNKKSHVVTHVH